MGKANFLTSSTFNVMHHKKMFLLLKIIKAYVSFLIFANEISLEM